jgi:hypothetical protein
MIGHIPLISKHLRDIFEKTVRRVGPINFELRLRGGARRQEAEVRCISNFLLSLTNQY